MTSCPEVFFVPLDRIMQVTYRLSPATVEQDRVAVLAESMGEEGQLEAIRLRWVSCLKAWHPVDGAHRVAVAHRLGWPGLFAVETCRDEEEDPVFPANKHLWGK